MSGQKRPKTTVEECLCLDIDRLHRKSLLTPFNFLTISWNYTTADHNGRPAGSIGIVVLDNALKLSYALTDKDTGKQQDYNINVPIEWIPCSYGGTRPYFTCPDCYRRVLKLYKPPSQELFSCRHCWDLTYRSCQDSGDDQARARARTERACRKLGIKNYGNYEDAYYKTYVLDRPKGMHKKTFERLRQAVFEAADEEDEAYMQVLHAFAKRMERRNHKARKMLGWKDGSVGELI